MSKKMDWILQLVESGYEVWFLPTIKMPDKYVKVRVYNNDLSKALELNLEKSFLHAETDLVLAYIENQWKSYHNEELAKALNKPKE